MTDLEGQKRIRENMRAHGVHFWWRCSKCGAWCVEDSPHDEETCTGPWGG